MSGPASVVSVGTTATNMLTPNVSAIFKNLGPVTVFLSSANTVTADVSATGGWALHPGESITLTGNGFTVYWGITASNTAYVSILQ